MQYCIRNGQYLRLQWKALHLAFILPVFYPLGHTNISLHYYHIEPACNVHTLHRFRAFPATVLTVRIVAAEAKAEVAGATLAAVVCTALLGKDKGWWWGGSWGGVRLRSNTGVRAETGAGEVGTAPGAGFVVIVLDFSTVLEGEVEILYYFVFHFWRGTPVFFVFCFCFVSLTQNHDDEILRCSFG